MKAIISRQKTFCLSTAAKPVPAPNQILVRVVAAGANVGDSYKIKRSTDNGIPLGSDFAGYVDTIGPDIPAGLLSAGQRVAGYTSGEMGGAFGEYCIAIPELTVPLPDHISFEQGATIGISGFTAAQALLQPRPIPNPNQQLKTTEPILIWGASSVLGMYTVQLARLSGYTVIATASPSNHELLKALGASAVFDYRASNVTEAIREHTGNKLTFALDCISNAETAKLVTACFGSQGGHLITSLRYSKEDEELRADVKAEFIFVFKLLGVTLAYPEHTPPVPELFSLGKDICKLLTELLRDDRLKVPPIEVVPGGLAGVPAAIDDLVAGKVRSKKLIFRIADTA